MKKQKTKKSESDRDRVMMEGSLRGNPRPTLSVPRRRISGGIDEGGDRVDGEGTNDEAGTEAEGGNESEGTVQAGRVGEKVVTSGRGGGGGGGTLCGAMEEGGIVGVDEFILLLLLL